MAIVCYDQHDHPPPPAICISSTIKNELVRVVRAFGGSAECTARCLITSPMLPIMLNGQTELTETHIALFNQDALNHILRKMRSEEYPWGTDFQGVQYLMRQQSIQNPYIRQTIFYPDGHFIILCQFREQSQLLLESYEIQADKTFSRTACREFEINSYNHKTHRTTTIARIFTDYEDEDGYYQGLELCFKTAEDDIGRRIPWGHLVSSEESPIRVKAILVDEHSGQMAGLGKYFEKEYPFQNRHWHITRIVKVCCVHYYRTINRLMPHVDKSISYYI